MKNKIIFFSLILLLIPSFVISQNLPKDSLLGNIKKLREKVVFLTEIENPQFLYIDDYGHSGFSNPESAISKFFNMWYGSNLCYYINYEKYYNREGKITKEIWFGKKDNFMRSYKYFYDQKDRLIRVVDSTNHSVYVENHFFEEYGDYLHENIIRESIENNYFSFEYKRYKKGKIILTKDFDEYGAVDKENSLHYNDNGKISFIINQKPSTWKKVENNSWVLNFNDSIDKPHKNIEFEYDEKGRLIRKTYFNIKEYTNTVVPEIAFTNIYEGKNLVTHIIGKNNAYNYRYDKYGRLSEKYCCDKNISKASIIQKYTYTNNEISGLLYTEDSYPSKKRIEHKITYNYKYDSNKNWIEIIKTVNGVKLFKWIREIEYY